MGHENENNRSSAMTPEIIATINAAVSTGVKDAISGLFEHLGPLLRDMNKPYKDPDVERRALRDKLKFKQDEIEGEKAKRLLRDSCSHRDKNGRVAIGVVRNFPDRHPRGICTHCQEWFYPREYRFDNPTEDKPYGTPHIVDAHPQYQLVYDAIAQQES